MRYLIVKKHFTHRVVIMCINEAITNDETAKLIEGWTLFYIESDFERAKEKRDKVITSLS